MIVRRAYRAAGAALNLAGTMALLIWWAPTVLVLVAGILAQGTWWRLGMILVRGLQRLGFNEASDRLAGRLVAEVELWKRQRMFIRQGGDQAPR